MPDHARNRDWLDAEELESGGPGLPRPDLNPLMNPLLGANMGRWAQVYFTSPPDQREQAVEKLLLELKAGIKPARSEFTHKTENAAISSVPASRPELEFPALPIQASTNDELDTSDAAALHVLVLCPGCGQRNPAEQRFCGICGTSLTRDVAVPGTSAAPPEQALKPIENPESDWRWLRERTLSTYEVQSETGNRSPRLIISLVLVVIGLGGYILWQNRARLFREQAPPSASSVSETGSSPSMNLPIAATTSLPSVQQVAKAKSQTNTTSSNTAAMAAASDKMIARPAESSIGLPSDDGRDDLLRARQYLAGEGVPKNSWMASQFLWKAIGKQNSEAVLVLSDLYARGDGVPRSCEQARILLVSAARKGSSAAAQKLRSIETGCR